MGKTRVVERFWSNGDEVIFRYPRFTDCDGMLRAINSLVAERAFIARQVMKTKEEQQRDTRRVMRGIRKREVVGLVVEMNGELVGWAVIAKDQQGTSPQVGILGFLFLVKKARGKGIAECLVLAVAEEAKRVLQIKRIILETSVRNHPAVRLYEKCGFVRIPIPRKERKPYILYGRRPRRVRMEKLLQ